MPTARKICDHVHGPVPSLPINSSNPMQPAAAAPIHRFRDLPVTVLLPVHHPTWPIVVPNNSNNHNPNDHPWPMTTTTTTACGVDPFPPVVRRPRAARIKNPSNPLATFVLRVLVSDERVLPMSSTHRHHPVEATSIPRITTIPPRNGFP